MAHLRVLTLCELAYWLRTLVVGGILPRKLRNEKMESMDPGVRQKSPERRERNDTTVIR